MRSKKTMWLALALVAGAGSAVVACSSTDDSSADGGSSADPAPTDGDAGNDGDATVRDASLDTKLPPAVDAGTRDTGSDAVITTDTGTGSVDADLDAADASSDAAITDASVDASTDASVDAADGGAATGSACAQDQQIEKRLCGYCGTESRLCAAGADDAGLVWQPWGECRGQLTGDTRCLPGSTRDVSCGMCGKQPQTCQNDCSWATGFCNQPTTSVCKPDASDYVSGLSCDAGGRIRYCQNDCTYSGFSECFDPTKVVDSGTTTGPVAGAVNIALSSVAGANKVTVTRTMAQTPTLARLNTFADCPAASISTTARSFDYIVIRNPDAVRTAKVSVWSFAQGSSVLDTVMAGYANRSTPPVTDAERQACTVGVNDDCDGTVANDGTACQSSWAGLFDETNGFNGIDYRLTIAPGQTAVVYVSGYFATDYGDYQLSVRTESLQ